MKVVPEVVPTAPLMGSVREPQSTAKQQILYLIIDGHTVLTITGRF